MTTASDINVNARILNLISEIDEFKGAWKLLGRLTPERLKVLKRVATIESIGSSTRIEGVKLSDREVEALLSNLDTCSFRTRDEQEVAGYAFVCEEVFSSFAHIPITENTIKQLHGRLLKYSEKDQRHSGEYKTLPNHVEAFDPDGNSLSVVFETASPFDTPFKMQELVYWTRENLESRELHPLLVTAIFVVTFLAIHPFQDGNGRLSRVLTTLLLLKSGYVYVSYSSLESIIGDNKEGYYLALRRTQQTLNHATPNFEPWFLFFFRSLHKQKCLLEQKLARETDLNLHLPEVSAQILDLLLVHGKLSITEMLPLMQVNQNTLRKHVQSLVQNRQILQHGKGRLTFYTLL